jgi:hypothetical protein
MTLIAAFRCEADGSPAVVICADSQETYGNYKVTVDKIKPRDAGNFDLVVGGSGNIGALIDGLANAIERNISHWESGFTEEAGRQQIERVLLAYHAKQVSLYPAKDDEKELRFLVCIRDKATSQIHLWKTDGTTAETVSDYALLGWQEPAYDHEVKWLYRKGFWVAQAVLLGVRLFTISRNSLYIGGPTQVIVVRDNGMHLQNPKNVELLEERAESFSHALARVVLACPDGSIHQGEFKALFAVFEDEVFKLRDYYLNKTASLLINRALGDPRDLTDAYSPLPPHTIVARKPDGRVLVFSGEPGDILIEHISTEDAENDSE